MLSLLTRLGYGRIFFLRFDHSENVRDIFFLRQLSHDEAARKVIAIQSLSNQLVLRFKDCEVVLSELCVATDHQCDRDT